MRIFEIAEDTQWIEQAATVIHRDCQPYLQQIRNNVSSGLYRGVLSHIVYNQNFLKSRVEIDRQPMSTPFRLHAMVDDWFLEHYGNRYRSNSVFATGSDEQARPYGDVFALFPIGDFKFCWSANIHDLYDEWGTIERESKTMDEDKLREIINKTLTRGEYRTENLPAAIKSGHEVMLKCEYYYLLNVATSRPYRLSVLQHALDAL